MRLICPNCGAQYKVGDDVIPEAGRDVQCSNCEHTWFENRGAAEMATPAPELAEDVKGETENHYEAPPTSQARKLDPSVADVLRQEAEYEQAARAAEGGPLETQTDLDLSQDPADQNDQDRHSREARDRLARLRGEEGEIAAAVGATIADDANMPRRDLLPDIEEINSSLRPDAASIEADIAAEAPRQKSGFRRGFTFVIVIVLIALALYVFAPQISAAVPQFEDTLTSYSDWVDGLRIALDQQLQGLLNTSPETDAVIPEPSDG